MSSNLKEKLKEIKFINNTYIRIKRKVLQARISRNGHEVLNTANRALKEKNLIYYADFGTLLGFVREGDFIEHDPDIDISVVVDSKHTKQVVEEALIQAGFSKFLTYLKDDMVAEEAYVLKGIKMDVFYAFPYNDSQSKIHSFLTENIQYREPFNKTTETMIFSTVTETIIFKNEKLEFPIPENYEQIIIEKYGENWRQPIKVWTPEDYAETISNKSADGIQIRHF